jgi:hypothetical protein
MQIRCSPLFPLDDAGGLGAGSRRWTTLLPLSLRCWPRLVLKDTVILAGGWPLVVDGARAMLAQMARHPEAEIARLEPLRRPSTGLGTPLTAACFPIQGRSPALSVTTTQPPFSLAAFA